MRWHQFVAVHGIGALEGRHGTNRSMFQLYVGGRWSNIFRLETDVHAVETASAHGPVAVPTVA